MAEAIVQVFTPCKDSTPDCEGGSVQHVVTQKQHMNLQRNHRCAPCAARLWARVRLYGWGGIEDEARAH